MTTAKCDQKGCTYSATHIKASYAKAMVGRHKHAVHGIPGAHYKRKDGLPRQPRKPVPVGNSPAENQTQPDSQPLTIPNFCPNCGCGIRAIMVAMNLRNKR